MLLLGETMGLRIWGSLISENQMSYEVLLDCAADGEGNEYVIVHLPKNQIVETFLLHPIIKMGQIYGSHSIHTKYARQVQQEQWKKKQPQKNHTSKSSSKKSVQENSNQENSNQENLLFRSSEPVEPLRAEHQMWGYIDAEVSIFIANAWGINSENFKKSRSARQEDGELYQSRFSARRQNHNYQTIHNASARKRQTKYNRNTYQSRKNDHFRRPSIRTKIPRPRNHPTIKS